MLSFAYCNQISLAKSDQADPTVIKNDNFELLYKAKKDWFKVNKNHGDQVIVISNYISP
jgi:hypothetical protein